MVEKPFVIKNVEMNEIIKISKNKKLKIMCLQHQRFRNETIALKKFLNKNKYLAITTAGYDEYYILPGGNNLQVENGGLSNDLTGASKAKLKSAFGKSMKSKITSRQLLNKFVKLVA